MHTENVIRRASVEDAEQILTLKRNYILQMYRGFLTQDALERATEDYTLETISSWLKDSEKSVQVMKRRNAGTVWKEELKV